jgi:hypothetical protein
MIAGLGGASSSTFSRCCAPRWYMAGSSMARVPLVANEIVIG